VVVPQVLEIERSSPPACISISRPAKTRPAPVITTAHSGPLAASRPLQPGDQPAAGIAGPAVERQVRIESEIGEKHGHGQVSPKQVMDIKRPADARSGLQSPTSWRCRLRLRPHPSRARIPLARSR
jgi:hypothetical protein